MNSNSTVHLYQCVCLPLFLCPCPTLPYLTLPYFVFYSPPSFPSFTLSLSLSFFIYLSLPLSHTQTQTHTHYLPLTSSIFQSVTHTHIHTHTHIQYITLSLPLMSICLGDTPNSITENEFQTMGQVSEGYSGSDISVVVSTSELAVVRSYQIYKRIVVVRQSACMESGTSHLINAPVLFIFPPNASIIKTVF